MLILLALTQAHAVDADVFQPASSLPTGTGTLAGEAPQLGEPGFSGGIGAGIVANPVVRSFESERPDQAEVATMVPLILHGGYTVGELGRVDVVMPVYALADAPLNDFSGPAAGDLRLQATVPISGLADKAVNLAIVPRLELPTGSTNALTTQGLAGTLLASVGSDLERWGWVASLGPSAGRTEDIEPGVEVAGFAGLGTAGGWYHATSTTRVGAELDLRVSKGNTVGVGRLFAQERMTNGVGIAAGVGTGLIAAIGTPEAHGYLAITYAVTERDTDGDGIVDDDDVCPNEPEDRDGFEDTDGCPELDNDGDRILDAADRCPMIPEDIDGFADDDGCLDDDNDGDGILDVDDRCPVDFGPAETQGCPDNDADDDGILDPQDECPEEPGPLETRGCPDRDGDLVPDHRDACPDEPRPPDEDPSVSDGCPKIAYVGDGQVTITERVEFDTGKSTIKTESERILQAVADVVKSTPRILRMEVQGHTDNVGSEASNLRLSNERAEAVRTWLVDHGVPVRKLTAKGYGESTPIDSNRTPGGRENNRRVQFQILEMAPPTPEPSPPEEPAESPWDDTQGSGQGSGSESGPGEEQEEEVWGPSE